MTVINRIERLKTKLNRLTEELGREIGGDEQTLDQIVIKIRKTERAIKTEEMTRKVLHINAREQAKRHYLKQFLKFGVIDSDLFTNDVKLHKNKSKQAPKLYKWAETNNVRFSYGHDNQLQANIYVNDLRTTVEIKATHRTYNNGNGRNTSEPKEFDSFKHACSYNGVRLKDITVEQVVENIEKLKRVTDDIKAQIEKADQQKKKLDAYFLESEGFTAQSKQTFHGIY